MKHNTSIAVRPGTVQRKPPQRSGDVSYLIAKEAFDPARGTTLLAPIRTLPLSDLIGRCGPQCQRSGRARMALGFDCCGTSRR